MLLVVGGHDLEPVHLAADRIRAQVPRARRVDYAHAAHLPSMEDPAPFLQLLLEGVAGQD